MAAVNKPRKTVLRQAIADMSHRWCPVTGNIPTRMTAAGFKVACEGFQEKANLRHGIAKFQAKKYETCRICKGETMPIGLEIISLDGLQAEIIGENMKAKQNKDGICDVCEQQKSGLKSAYGHQACSSCRILMTGVKKRPGSVIKYMQEVHGNRYFPKAVHLGPVGELFPLKVHVGIREALGADDVAVVDLPGLVLSKMTELAEAKRLVLDNQDIIDMLNCEIETQAAIIKDLASPALLPEDISETGADIVIKCDMLKKMLVEKNKSYGDSALDPVRVFSRADPEEQLLVRIDDKLSRLSRGKEFAGDDTVMDLIGYLVLLLVHRDRADINMKEAA